MRDTIMTNDEVQDLLRRPLTAEELRELIAWYSAKLDRCTIAVHDAINRPKGVVPASAMEFYRPEGT